MLSVKLICGVVLLFLGAVLVYYGVWVPRWYVAMSGSVSFCIGAFLASDAFFRHIKGR